MASAAVVPESTVWGTGDALDVPINTLVKCQRIYSPVVSYLQNQAHKIVSGYTNRPVRFVLPLPSFKEIGIQDSRPGGMVRNAILRQDMNIASAVIHSRCLGNVQSALQETNLGPTPWSVIPIHFKV